MRARLFLRLVAWTRWAGPLLVLASAPILLLQSLLYFTGTTGITGDFVAYWSASRRLAAGGSPYLPDLLGGSVSSTDTSQYLYPPPLAQLLLPLAPLDLTLAQSIFTLLSLAIFTGSLVVAWRHAGGALSLRGALVGACAIGSITSFYSVVLNGNLGLLLAAATAAAFVANPLAAGVLGGLAKLLPGPLILAARRRDLTRRVVLSLCALAIVSVASAPGAWRDYLTGALPATLSSEDRIGNGGNLAALARRAGTILEIRDGATSAELGGYDPAGVLARSPWAVPLPDGFLALLAALESPLRAASLLIAALLFAAGLRAARDERRRHVGAAYLVGGAFLVPWSFWDHYLIALLPAVVAAWRCGDERARARLVAGLALLSSPAGTLFGLHLPLVPALLLLLDGIRRTRLPESAVAPR